MAYFPLKIRVFGKMLLHNSHPAALPGGFLQLKWTIDFGGLSQKMLRGWKKS
jgi:hypothetical protein